MRAWPKTECPTCKAKSGEMCRDKAGKRCRAPHAKRPKGSLGGVNKPITLQMEIIDTDL